MPLSLVLIGDEPSFNVHGGIGREGPACPPALWYGDGILDLLDELLGGVCGSMGCGPLRLSSSKWLIRLSLTAFPICESALLDSGDPEFEVNAAGAAYVPMLLELEYSSDVSGESVYSSIVTFVSLGVNHYDTLTNL